MLWYFSHSLWNLAVCVVLLYTGGVFCGQDVTMGQARVCSSHRLHIIVLQIANGSDTLKYLPNVFSRRKGERQETPKQLLDSKNEIKNTMGLRTWASRCISVLVRRSSFVPPAHPLRQLPLCVHSATLLALHVPSSCACIFPFIPSCAHFLSRSFSLTPFAAVLLCAPPCCSFFSFDMPLFRTRISAFPNFIRCAPLPSACEFLPFLYLWIHDISQKIVTATCVKLMYIMQE